MLCAVQLCNPRTLALPLLVEVIFSFFDVLNRSALGEGDVSGVVFGTSEFVVPESTPHQRFEFVFEALNSTTDQAIDSEKSLVASLVIFSTISCKFSLSTHGVNLFSLHGKLFSHCFVVFIQKNCFFVNTFSVLTLR